MARVAETENPNEASSPDEVEALPPIVQGVLDDLKKEFPNLSPTARSDEWVEVYVTPDEWHDVALVLRDRLNFDYLSLLSAVDYEEKGFQVVYHLFSLFTNKKLVVKVDLPNREDPVLPSITDVWPTANFHEREAWDLMGIRFEGHPDLRRILMREDWEGHPLRKDYVDDRVPRERQTRETYAEALAEQRRREEQRG